MSCRFYIEVHKPTKRSGSCTHNESDSTTRMSQRKIKVRGVDSKAENFSLNHGVNWKLPSACSSSLGQLESRADRRARDEHGLVFNPLRLPIEFCETILVCIMVCTGCRLGPNGFRISDQRRSSDRNCNSYCRVTPLRVCSPCQIVWLSSCKKNEASVQQVCVCCL